MWCFFDIDGTLLSCRGRGLRAMHRAVQQVFGLPPADAVILPGGKTDPMLFEEIAAAYAVPPQDLGARREELERAYAREFEMEIVAAGACEPKPGVGGLLAALSRESGVGLGVVTGNLERTAWLKLRGAGLEGYFVLGGFGSEARAREDLVARALERAEARAGGCLERHRVWVIGDTPADVASGRAHGTRTLAVATGGFPRAALEASGADVVLDDFMDTETVVGILCRQR